MMALHTRPDGYADHRAIEPYLSDRHGGGWDAVAPTVNTSTIPKVETSRTIEAPDIGSGWDAVIGVQVESTGTTKSACTTCGPEPIPVQVADIPAPAQDIIVSVGTRDWLLWLLIAVAVAVGLYLWGK